MHFLGHRAYSVLPSYLRGLDVATLPSAINSYTRAMFPMKYFEYLAAGLPIVSTPLEFTQTHQAGLVIGDTAEAFQKAIEQQLARGRLTDEESERYVADNTWNARLQKMLGKIGIRLA
jgi:glycosyltransferase involved in cell wall biosynthesis